MAARETRVGRRSGGLAARLLFLGLLLPGAALAQSWEHRTEQEGVRVETRPVPGSGIAAFRGSTEIDAPVDTLLAVLSDAERYPEWFPDCPKAFVLSQEGNTQVRYAVTATPWPVSDRDAIYRSVVERDPETGGASIRIGVEPDAYPRQDGHVRVLEAEGLWTLVPVTDSRTAVTWEMHLEPGGSVPEWVINRRVVDTPLRALQGLAQEVARKGAGR